MSDVSGLWLAVGIGVGGVLLVLLIEWLLLRTGGASLPTDDGTADRRED